MQIYSGPLSMFGAKAEIAAHEKGIAFELEMVPFGMQRLYEPKHPDVLRINPKRQVPVLIDSALEIFDSTQIFEYLEHRFPTPPLWPAAPEARARARLLEMKSDEVFFPHVVRLMPIQRNRDHPDWVPSRAGIEAYYAAMEDELAGREHLAGAFGYADIAFYMAQFFAARMGVPMTSALPRLTAWRLRVAARPAVARVVGAMTAYLTSIGRPPPPYA
jgi:glutathione S-transferase